MEPYGAASSTPSAISPVPQPVVISSGDGGSNKRVVVIPRDYSEGELCQFSTVFPKELEGKIEAEVLRKTVDEINAIMRDAESLNRHHVFESIVGCLSCYLTYIFTTTYYQKCLNKLKRFLEEENERIYLPTGLLVRDPAETALQHVSHFHSERPIEKS